MNYTEPLTELQSCHSKGIRAVRIQESRRPGTSPVRGPSQGRGSCTCTHLITGRAGESSGELRPRIGGPSARYMLLSVPLTREWQPSGAHLPACPTARNGNPVVPIISSQKSSAAFGSGFTALGCYRKSGASITGLVYEVDEAAYNNTVSAGKA